MNIQRLQIKSIRMLDVSKLCILICLLLVNCSTTNANRESNSEIYFSDLGHCIKKRGFSWGEISPEIEIPENEDNYWHNAYRVIPRYIADLELDTDGDGFVRRDEFIADSNSIWKEENKNIISVISEGFDCYYTAHVGRISDDNLLDIIIQDPSEKIVPAMRAFVLIQEDDHTFTLDDASKYEMPEELTEISSHVTITELNGDSSRDLFLQNLSEFIPKTMDHVIFGYVRLGHGFYRSMPSSITAIDSVKVTFFRQLSEWIKDPSFFTKFDQENGDGHAINADAYQLATESFQRMRETGELPFPTDYSRVVSNAMRNYLGIDIFSRNLSGCANGIISYIGDSTMHTGTIQDILEVLGFVREHLTINLSECV